MFYAVARFDFLIPQSRSLKEKRAVLNRLKDRLAHRFRLSVAEVDHQDLRQRGALGVALVVSGPGAGRNALAAVLREIDLETRVTLIDRHERVGRIDDEPTPTG